MKTTKFSGAKLSRFKATVKGAKIQPDARPELYLSRGINKFVINGTAAAKMGLVHGDCVTIVCDPEATDVNEKYILIQTDEKHGNKLAAHKGDGSGSKPLAFNNSIIWSQMIQMTADAQPMSEAALCQAGLMGEYETIKGRAGQMCSAILAKSRVSFTPREIEGAPSEIDGIPVVKIWELVDAKRFMVKEDGKTISKFPVGEEVEEAEQSEMPAAEESTVEDEEFEDVL